MIRYKNTDKENNWLENTAIFCVNKPAFKNLLADGENQVFVGACNFGQLKKLDFDIKAPSKTGEHKLEFQLGYG